MGWVGEPHAAELLSFTRRFTCCQASEGEYATKDANYLDVLTLVGLSERYFVAAFMNHWFLFVISNPYSELPIHMFPLQHLRFEGWLLHDLVGLAA